MKVIDFVTELGAKLEEGTNYFCQNVLALDYFLIIHFLTRCSVLIKVFISEENEFDFIFDIHLAFLLGCNQSGTNPSRPFPGWLEP